MLWCQACLINSTLPLRVWNVLYVQSKVQAHESNKQLSSDKMTGVFFYWEAANKGEGIIRDIIASAVYR